jgi:D-alanine-D-alanine ligase
MNTDSMNKSKEEILKTPINKLGIDILNSDLEPYIQKLYAELDQLGITFHPLTYLSDSWGCPDGTPVIGMPFYLVNEALREIEKEKIGTVENNEEIQKIFRHEAGHAFNYAYSLYKLPRWQEIFGVYDKPYEDNFASIPGSGKFVRHLEGWYAQKHPDEDFAETFALIITPGFDWKSAYKGTKAYKKLAYVSELIKQYKGKPVQAVSGALDVPIESISLTVEEWYKKRISSLKPTAKILILFYQEYPKKMPTHDEVVDQVKKALLQLGYNVVLLPINQSIERIINGIKEEKPDLIFNLCETFRNNDKFDFNVTALLEMMRVPFTGSSSGSLFLSNDKYISKKIFDFHRIPYPDFLFIPIGCEVIIPKNLSFPLFVKPAHEDASIGVDENSKVQDEESLKKKVKEIHEIIKDDALVEEYIEGREFFVSVMGNKFLKPFEIVELDFSRLPQGRPKIYTYKAKIEIESEEYKMIDIKIPQDLTPELKDKIQELAIKVYQVLGASDYARMDIRMDQNGKLYVLEANLNPYLARNSETAIAAEASGLSYEHLIGGLVEEAFARTSSKV